MTPESKIKVTFSRVYEIEMKDILQKFKNDGFTIIEDLYQDEIIEKAVELALNHLAEDLPYFEESPIDFVSHKIKVIE